MLFAKVGVALTTTLLVAVSLSLPIAAPALAFGAADTVLAAPARIGDNASGVAETSTPLVLTSGVQRVGLDGSPQLVAIEGLSESTTVSLRHFADGSWSGWTTVLAHALEAPDNSEDPVAGPIWIGHGARFLDVRLTGAVGQPRLVGLHVATVANAGGHQNVAQEDPTSTSTSSTTTTAVPDGEPPDEPDPPDEPRLEPDGEFIQPRTAWATTDMEWNCEKGPFVADELRAAIVHHTAGANDYAPDDVPGIIRAIWHFHTQTRGWCDIAYNFVVDAFGGVWEARRGGIDRAILGGHTRGFNTSSVGIAQLGNMNSVEPTVAMSWATTRIVGWKLGLHGVDPEAHTTLVNRTDAEFRGVPDGEEVAVRGVNGHRDLGSTSCPGDHTYEDLDALRADSVTGVYVFALHRAFLGRAADPASFKRWVTRAEAGGVPRAAVEMARSADYSGLIIEDLYRRVLGRGADAAGKAYWLGVLESGVRVEDVGVQFYGSAEYVESFADIEAYVTALYSNLLHREPDADGLAFWRDKLVGGSALPPDVAHGFYLSIESRRDRVVRLYDTILGRPPDTAGREYWAEQLLTTDDVLLAVELSLSDEFYERATT